VSNKNIFKNIYSTISFECVCVCVWEWCFGEERRDFLGFGGGGDGLRGFWFLPFFLSPLVSFE